MKYSISGMLMVACFFLTGNSNAQNDIDALRYSQLSFGTTSRSLAMGGAFGGLGADFSNMSTNPAGLAFYKRGEFTFSPDFQNTNVKSDFLGNINSENRFNFGINNMGFIFAGTSKQKEGWKGLAFGIGYNKLASFSSNSYYEGKNDKNSLLDAFAESAQGHSSSDLDPFNEGLAYNAYLLDYDSSSGKYYTALPNAGEIQRRTVRSRGSLGEFDLAFAANYNDKIFIGTTLAFPYIHYTEDSYYEEVDTGDSSLIGGYDLRSYEFDNSLATTGAGFTLKAGIIIKPVEFLRIGAAIHTPTWFFSMHDRYSSFIAPQYVNDSYQPVYAEGEYNYKLTTPFRAIGSLGFVIAKDALISAEYEYVDYSSSELNAYDYSFNAENNAIRQKYTSASNFRFGAEYRYEVFSIRGGFAYQGTPFNSKPDFGDQSQMTYSGGLGLREKHFFMDIAFAYKMNESFYQPYTLTDNSIKGEVPGANFETHRFNMLFTFGVKF